MKLIRSFIYLYCFLFFANCYAGSVIYPELPLKGNFVVDQTETLKSIDIDELNKISASLWQEKKIPIVTILITSLGSMGAGDQSIARYTQELFNHWQLGLKERNYGIILLVSLSDRKARIEFGRDWDHRYDKEARDIMQYYIVPKFKNAQYARGIIDGVKALNKLVRGLKLPEIKQPWWYGPLAVGFILLIIGVIVSLFRSGRSGWGWALIIGIGLLLWYILRNSGNGGGLSGGGSGGGGGATGSW